MLKKLFLSAFLSVCIHSSYSQNLTKMNAWQDSLQKLSTQIFGTISEAERIEGNFKFVKTLVSSLKETNSFFYDYNQLKTISILRSPDNSFRLFTWNIPLDDGSYLYYGSIQFNSGNLKLIPLMDQTFEIKSVDDAVLTPKEWFGAQYYDIVLLKPNQYALLGWKGHHPDHSKKVIEILNILPNGEVSLGATVFSNDANLTRKVFSYTKQASMLLKYNKDKRRIEFDHIVPMDPNMVGNYKYYGPDLSYDVYLLKNGKLELQENIELQNSIDGKEDKYIDPLKLNKSKKSGL